MRIKLRVAGSKRKRSQVMMKVSSLVDSKGIFGSSPRGKVKARRCAELRQSGKRGQCVRKIIMLVLEIEMWGGSLGSRYRKPLSLGTVMFQERPNSSKAKMFQKNYGNTQSWRLVALSGGDTKKIKRR